MQLKTLLNRVHPIKGFVYGRVRFEPGARAPKLIVIVSIRPRKRSRPTCSGCGERGPQYDRLALRLFQFVPLWGFVVFFEYAMRRVDCPKCKRVKVERVPWAEGKSPITTAYAWFLASWAKRMSWQDVARSFRTSWDSVYRAVKLAVAWGLAHRDLSGIEAIGVDEVLWHRGHKYLTVVYQIDNGCRRLLWLGKDRTSATLNRFFDSFGEHTQSLKFVCSDMWQGYLKVIKKRAKGVMHILDRFHIAQNLSKAVDKVRAEEARRMKADGYEPVLKKTRWLLLKRPKNLKRAQRRSLKDLLQYNLKTVRAYLLKEDLQHFWDYVSPTWAGKFLDQWCTRHALEDRAHEEDGSTAPCTQTPHSQLVRCQGSNLYRRGRGP